MPDAITVAAPPSLSARPLVLGLEGCNDVRLSLQPWENLAALLKSGDVDAALLPSIDYPRLAAGVERARTPVAGRRPAPTHFVILPAPAVTSRGAVGALKLFGYVEQEKLRRVLLDPASPTGSALARLIVRRRFGANPHFVMPDEVGRSPSRPPDAELVAGDRALLANFPRAEWDTDLGVEWHRWTYLPMVYAMWVARADAPLERLLAILGEAAAKGLATRESMAAEAAAKGKAPVELVRRFLMDQTRYAFGPKELQGLTAFLEMAGQDGLAPDAVRLDVAAGS